MFCSLDDTVPLDWLRLQSHLRGLGHHLDLDLDLGAPPRQFAGGLGSLNFLICPPVRACPRLSAPGHDILDFTHAVAYGRAH